MKTITAIKRIAKENDIPLFGKLSRVPDEELTRNWRSYEDANKTLCEINIKTNEIMITYGDNCLSVIA